MFTSSQVLNTLACLAVCITLASAPGRAEDDDNRLDEAWKDAVGDQEPVLTEKQFATLNNLAFQAAVTNICDGYKLDGDKFAKGIAEVASTPNPDLSDDDAGAWETAVLIRFGMSYGLLLAEGNAHTDTFCASAKEMKADSEVPNVWQ
jgi:hypothetical protein